MTPSQPRETGPEPDPADVETFERLLAEVIEAHATGGGEAVRAVCEAHPEHAQRLRARLASLQRLGLLGEEREASAPTAFGHYRVQRKLGQGGMSVVYLAWDERLQRRVALKACHALDEQDDRTRARFEHEIQAVARLEHPGIVRIFDVGEAEGRLFYTMEYVEGATLAELVASLRMRGDRLEELTGDSVRRLLYDIAAAGSGETPPVPSDDPWPRTWVETLCRWMLDIANALAHAHAAGIVHRDVKPSNIIVGLDGRARLFDLGLARLDDRPGLTRSGDFTGTPYYVSPEQLTGHHAQVDQRTDVFSSGVTLYELLTFRRPFDGRSTAQVFKQIVDRDPPVPRRLDGSIPADLETICLAALEKRPEARYQGMADMAADLQRFLEFSPVHARPVGWIRRTLRFVRRSPARASAALLGLAIAVGLPTGLFLANQAVKQQRDLAEDNALEATRQAELNARVTDFLVELFHLTPVEIARAESVTAREILDRGAARIPTGFEDQPLVRASLLRANGLVYANMGLAAKALPMLDRALAIFERELGESHLDTATLLHELGRVHLTVGNLEASASLCRRSLDGFEAAGTPGHADAVRCRLSLAEASRQLTETDTARQHLEQALVLCEELPEGADDALAADVLEQLGQLDLQSAAPHDARARLEASLAIRRRLWVPDPLSIARGLTLLASAHLHLGEDETAGRLRSEAEQLRRVALAAEGSPTPTDAEVSATTLLLPEGPFALRAAWRGEYDAAFQQGITALQAGQYDSSRAAFERCLALSPGHTICAYNIACGQARAGNIDAALAWLERAIDFGFGFVVDGPPVMEKDADLAALREHPRWPVLFERMTGMRAEAEAYAARPAVHRPASARGDVDPPLLVVLHADGSTKQQVIDGPWRQVAEELGMLLLAPSAGTPTARDPREGMRWFRDLEDFLRRPWAYETPVIEAISGFLDDNRVDRQRVFIAGEGLGALIAADLALTAPGLFGGVAVFNGPLLPEIAWKRTRVAASVGLGVQVVLDEREACVGAPEGVPLERFADDVGRWLAAWGLGDRSQVQRVDTGDTPRDVRVRALRELQARAARQP